MPVDPTIRGLSQRYGIPEPELRAALDATVRLERPSPDRPIGDSFGKYALIEMLGEGGFGAVWPILRGGADVGGIFRGRGLQESRPRGHLEAVPDRQGPCSNRK